MLVAPSATVRNLRLLQLFWFLREFQLWIPVWIVFLTLEQGFSFTQVASAEGLFLLGVLVLEVPTGAVADRYGRKISIAAGAFCLGGSVLIFAFATTFPILLASFMLWSVASTLMSGADMALLFDTLKGAGRDHEYERIAGRGTALSWAGVGFATLLGGPVAALTSTAFTIYAGAATCVLTGLIALAIHEPPHRKEGEEQGSYASSIGNAFKDLWRHPGVRAVVLLAGTTAAALEAIHYLVQPYLIDRDIEVGVVFSLLQVPIYFAGFAGALLASRFQARVGTVRALIVGPAVGALGYAALAVTPGLGGYIAFPLVVAIGSAIAPISTGYVNRHIGSERRATVLSIQGMVLSLVLAALAPGVGFATDHWGVWAAFVLGGAMAAAAAIGLGPALIARAKDEAALLEESLVPSP